MNNHVGYFPYLKDVKKLVIGTDGCGGNMFEELKLAFFKHKDAGGPWWPADFLGALSRNNELLESAFRHRARFGRIEPGYKADLVLFDPDKLEADGDYNKGFEAIMISGKPSLMNGKWYYPRAGEVL